MSSTAWKIMETAHTRLRRSEEAVLRSRGGGSSSRRQLGSRGGNVDCSASAACPPCCLTHGITLLRLSLTRSSSGGGCRDSTRPPSAELRDIIHLEQRIKIGTILLDRCRRLEDRPRRPWSRCSSGRLARSLLMGFQPRLRVLVLVFILVMTGRHQRVQNVVPCM